MAVDGIRGFGGTDRREKKMKHHMARRVVAAARIEAERGKPRLTQMELGVWQ